MEGSESGGLLFDVAEVNSYKGFTPAAFTPDKGQRYGGSGRGAMAAGGGERVRGW